MKTTSTKKLHDRILAAKNARKLLKDWANCQPDELHALAESHQDVFDFVANDEEGLKAVVENVGRYLRMAWEASESRHRDWYFFTARREYATAMLGSFAVLTRDGRGGRDVARRISPLVPPETAFDIAMFHVQTRLANKMAVCGNSRCHERYFFRRRKGQKYCSSDCAKPALLEAKLRWWKAEGKQWRAERQAKREKKKNHPATERT